MLRPFVMASWCWELQEELEGLRISHSEATIKLRMEGQEEARKDYERGRREALAEKEVCFAKEVWLIRTMCCCCCCRCSCCWGVSHSQVF
jgi:hypothetical protein